MASERADGGEPQQTGSPALACTRRGLIVGGAALLLSACVRSTGQVSSQQVPPPPEVPTPPRPAKPVVVPPRPATPPPADVTTYELVPRSAWTSEPVGPNNIAMGKVLRITVHHTDEHAGTAGLSDLDVIRRIEAYHRGPEKRWAAIGYHYLVGKDGKIYEGRPVKYQGAHVRSANPNNLGISVIGDFSNHQPNPKQLVALKAFLEDQRRQYAVAKDHVFGHRELGQSLCPGDALFAWVVKYRQG